jgi:hypothetical protein
MPRDDFEGVTSEELLVEAPPNWVRRMSDQYARTGTVAQEDAALLLGTKPENAAIAVDPEGVPNFSFLPKG